MIPKLEVKKEMPPVKNSTSTDIPVFRLHSAEEEKENHPSWLAMAEQKPGKKKNNAESQWALPFQGMKTLEPFLFKTEQNSQALPPQAIEILEKTSTALVMLFHEGKTMTTVTLDESFDTLKELIGSQIIIEEFSSAPKIFNVKICTTSEGLKALEGHLPSLIKLFEERKFGFSINRVDAELLDDRPLVHRKDPHDNEDSDQQNKR